MDNANDRPLRLRQKSDGEDPRKYSYEGIQMAIEVCNLNKTRDFGKSGDVRCDRQTKWGNPFIMYKEDRRDLVCDLYVDYFEEITKPDNARMVCAVLKAGGLTNEQVDIWIRRTGGVLDINELKDARRLFCHCFGKGTLVTTKRGFIPIEDVVIGDMVLTHNSRYHYVTDTMKFENVPTVKVKFQGIPEPLVCTKDHEFYACKRIRVQSNFDRKVISQPPEWIPADELKKEMNTSHLCGTVVGFPRDIPIDIDAHTPEFWYVIGRYLGDGWIINYDQKSCYVRKDGTRSRSRIWITGICTSKQKADKLGTKIKDAGFHACRTEAKTETWFRICNKKFTIFMEQFGRYSHGKHIPEWCFSLSLEKQKLLLQGCIDSDGYFDSSKQEISISTVSELLAFGIARLSRNVNNTQITFSKHKKPRDSMIDGRVIKARYPVYFIAWRITSRIMKDTVPKDNCVWMSFRSISEGETTDVYNLSVKGSNSYVVNGIAVHNCSPFRCHCTYLKKRIEALEGQRTNEG